VLAATTVTGGHTTIAFTEPFVRALYSKGLNTVATGTARLDDTHRAHLPITGGGATLYGTAAQLPEETATLRHAGGLRVSSGALKITVSAFVLTLGGAHPGITAAVTLGSDRRLPRTRLFDLEATTPARRTAGGATQTGMVATLDPAAGTALDSAFGTKVFGAYGAKKAGTVSVAVTT